MSTPAQPLNESQVSFITEFIKQKKAALALLEENPSASVYEFPESMDSDGWVNEDYVSYADFDPMRLHITAVQEGSAKQAKGVKFKFAEIKYVYPKFSSSGDKVNTVGDLYLEGPILKSDTGAQIKVNEQNQREEMVIRTSINDTDEEQAKYLDVLDQIYCTLIAFTHLKAAGFGFAKNARITQDSHNGFKPLVYFPRDQDGNISGRPTLFLKLEYRREGAKTSCWTTFSNPLDQNMPVSQVTNSTIEFVPLIHVRRIFSANAKSFQFSLKSSIITSIVSAGSSVRQSASIKRLNALDPSLQSRFAEQFQRIQSEKSVSSSSSSEEEPESADSEAPESTLKGLSSSRHSEDLELPAEEQVEADEAPAPVHRRKQFSLAK